MTKTRFFAIARDPMRGSYVHLVWTSYKRTLAAAIEEAAARYNAGACSMKPLFFDYGPGDSDLRRIDQTSMAGVFK